MEKVVILNSPIYKEKNIINNEDYLPPLGLGVIHSSLEKKYDVEFIDSLSDNLGIEDIIKYLLKENPKFVCINIFTTNYTIVKQIVENTNTEIHWIIGGISTKSLYKEIFEWKAKNKIDIIYGDGEKIIEDIIDSNIIEPPIEIKENRRFYIVKSSSKYYVKDISFEIINRCIFKNEPQVNIYNELEICIYTSRGCPYNCAYCVAACSRNKELGSIRHKKSESIISELKIIKQLYPRVVTIRILDDLFLVNNNSFNEAINIFNEIKLSWRAMCHIKSIKNIVDSKLKELAKSGCKELFIGIESGSPRILKKIHKTDNIDEIITSVSRLLSNGIHVKGYFICGFPNENIEDLDKTLNLATKLKELTYGNNVKFRNSTFQFRPYYGTELYDEIVKTSNIQNNSILNKIKPSDNINLEIRNKSVNFDSGNYSLVSDEILEQYIKKMNDLNGKHI